MTFRFPAQLSARLSARFALPSGDRRGWLVLRGWFVLFAVPLAVAAALAGGFALCQQTPIPGLDARTQSPAIIAHLNAAIQFYRSVNVPIQKAGEPNDVVYRDQAIAAAAQAAGFAFQSARAEAALLRQTGATPAASEQQQRIQTTLAATQSRIADLQSRLALLDRELAAASPRNAVALEAEKKQLQDALDLASAMKGALGRITTLSTASGAGLTADIARLQSSVPELQTPAKTASPQLITVEAALSAGVTTQGDVLFQLLESMHAIAGLLQENARLQQQAIALRAPMLGIVRNLIQQGQQLSQQAEQSQPTPPSPAAKGHNHASSSTPANPPPPDLQSITAQFKALSTATVPLSQEVLVLDQSRANLLSWQASVDQEYNSIFHALLLRLLVIVIALGVIVGGGEIWTRATNRYIRDLRRRRQFLVVRRVVVTFLSAIVVLFGFVTQFNSLATFAGFITAGIAVGLQTILLSVAAYFFIIGRYGIKVGDRITIAAVTGDVIEVGLVRFYLMELAGAGATLNPTGRVAVFSNAVLFQATVPLYKQVPGTGFAWHELTVRLAPATDYPSVCGAILREVQTVYEPYRPAVERQYETVRNWMHTSIDQPTIESRLQFSGDAFQFWVRFPVEIQRAAEIDEQLTQALLRLMESRPEVRTAIAATPSIQPAVRG